MKIAENCLGEPYTCKLDWEDDCSVQCGDSGVVFSKNGARYTAFFEAFPKNPRTFIRGEGTTIEEAEIDAWEQYTKIRNCKGHEFEKRGYRDGCGVCKHCDYVESDVFEPSEICCVCNKPTYYTTDIDNNWYCEEHKTEIPEEKRTFIHKLMEKRKLW